MRRIREFEWKLKSGAWWLLVLLGGCASPHETASPLSPIGRQSAEFYLAGALSDGFEQFFIAPGVPFDPKWKPHLAYVKRMANQVQLAWERRLNESATKPPAGTKTTVVFFLNSEGKVTRVIEVRTEFSDMGADICVSAIMDAGSYGAWTDAMKADLGEEQEFTLDFSYQ